jgi:CTP:phosphocholine cytidylyltransferase-like protein
MSKMKTSNHKFEIKLEYGFDTEDGKKRVEIFSFTTEAKPTLDPVYILKSAGWLTKAAFRATNRQYMQVKQKAKQGIPLEGSNELRVEKLV